MPSEVNAAGSVKIREANISYGTLADAMNAADVAGLKTFTLEIRGEVNEPEHIDITAPSPSHITIVGAEGPSSLNMKYMFDLSGGGSLTLGDGTDDNPLTISRSGQVIRVLNGQIIINNGVIIRDNSNNSIALELKGKNAKGAIYGGIIEGNDGVELKDGASISEIRDVQITGRQYAILLYNGSSINEIVSGSFIQTASDLSAPSDAIRLQEGSSIGLISGGYFKSVRSSPIMLIKDSRIDEIRDGEFVSVNNANDAGGICVASGSSIGMISGGNIHGGGNGILIQDTNSRITNITGGTISGKFYGMHAKGTSYGVDFISGGDFIGATALYNDSNFVGNSVLIKEISGGTFSGEEYGFDNSGEVTKITGGDFSGNIAIGNGGMNGSIGEISGGVFNGEESGMDNGAVINKITGGDYLGDVVGLYNYYSAEITEISGGSFKGNDYGIHNDMLSEITKISGGEFHGDTAMYMYRMSYVDEISGGVFKGNDYGIHNEYGSDITLISGGYFFGDYAIYNEEFSSIERITGGVFWGKNNPAIHLDSSTRIEPGLTAVKGMGRYWGLNGQIFNNNSLAILPTNYSMSTITEPVDGIAGVSFKYLLIVHYDVTFNGNEGGWNGGVTTQIRSVPLGGSVGAANMPSSPSRSGYTFTGWKDGADNDFVATTAVTDNIEVFAQWREGGGGGSTTPDPDPIRVSLEAYKTVTGAGAQLVGERFSFAVYEGNTVVATGRNDATGQVVFSPITYSRAGTYTYRMVETTTDGGSWRTDRREYAVTVVVTNSNNTLVAAITYPEGNPPTFRNEFIDEEVIPPVAHTASLRIAKDLLDQSGNATGTGLDFFVMLYEQTGPGEWLEVGEYTITANGAPTVIPDLPGEKTYQIVEKSGVWYSLLGYKLMSETNEVIGTAPGPSVAIILPALTKKMTVDILVSNEQRSEPTGLPEIVGPVPDPPLFEIMELDPPLALFISDHTAYIIGYPDGRVRPDLNITRGEVAAVFFRLLTDEARGEFWTQDNPFPDVEYGKWHNNAISVMHNMSILRGFPDRTFRPDHAITRGEFATIASYYARMTLMAPTRELDFSDTDGHWAAGEIGFAAAVGLVDGFPEGTFRPDQSITRAETMTLVNRMLERIPETTEDLLGDEMIHWPDNADPNAWYYLAVQEATNSHVPGYGNKTVPGLQFTYEYWAEMTENRDWQQLEKDWFRLYSKTDSNQTLPFYSLTHRD